MKKIITAGLLGGAITASLLGAGAANAEPNEYVGVEPGRLVQISVERTALLPLGQAQALTDAHKAFRAGDDDGSLASSRTSSMVRSGLLTRLSKRLPRCCRSRWAGPMATPTPPMVTAR